MHGGIIDAANITYKRTPAFLKFNKVGIFSNLFGFEQANELTRLGNAAANVKNFLDRYEDDNDVSYLIVSSWICKVGVIDMIQKNHWPPNYIVYVSINGHQTKMSMADVQLATIARLMKKVSIFGDDDLEEKIKDVLEGGPSFYELDSKLPQEIKNKF